MCGQTLDVIGVDRVLLFYRVRTALRALVLDEFLPQISKRCFRRRDRADRNHGTQDRLWLVLVQRWIKPLVENVLLDLSCFELCQFAICRRVEKPSDKLCRLPPTQKTSCNRLLEILI